MEILTIREKKPEIKAGDVISVSMSMELQIPKEDLDKTYVIDPNNYETKCNVSYLLPNNSGWTDVNYTDDAGCCSYDGIKDYLEDRVKKDLDYLMDYEIFDVDDNDCEYQNAKIRIKALKEETTEED